jgi:hypothetical protein
MANMKLGKKYRKYAPIRSRPPDDIDTVWVCACGAVMHPKETGAHLEICDASKENDSE